MSLPACIVTLFVIYPVLAIAGYAFYRFAQRRHPAPYREGDVRNRLIRPLRFTMYVVLLPLGATLSLAILGLLDPVFFLIRDLY